MSQSDNPFRFFRGIGEKFNYIGIEMIVERHSVFFGKSGDIPKLVASYVDKQGRLAKAEFDLCVLPALIAENPDWNFKYGTNKDGF